MVLIAHDPAPFMEAVALMQPGMSRVRRQVASYQCSHAATYGWSAPDGVLLMVLGFWCVETRPVRLGRPQWVDEIFFSVHPSLSDPVVSGRYGPGLLRAARLTLAKRRHNGMVSGYVLVRTGRGAASRVLPPGARLARLAGFRPGPVDDGKQIWFYGDGDG